MWGFGKSRVTPSAAVAIAAVLLGVSCANETRRPSPADAAGGSAGANAMPPATAGTAGSLSVMVPSNSQAGSSGAGGVAACASVTEKAELSRMPLDIVFMLDVSASMIEQMAAVKQRINEDFAQIIEDSGVDYRVIMIAPYASDGFCVPAPLGSSDCS